MSQIPADLRYTREHEWLKDLGDGTALVGITDYAQGSLGDVTFVELPKPGTSFAAGKTFGVVESVKAASDLYMPVAGTILERNESLASSPEQLNQDPYGAAWLVKIRLEDPTSLSGLLDAAAYTSITG